jgi:hypothetical protein
MIESILVNDFTGGLNYRADAFKLADNESPDLLNVDIDPRGGFSSRWGMKDYNATAIDSIASGSFTPRRLFAWDGPSRYLMIAANDKVYHTTSGTVSASITTTDNTYGASFAPWSSSSTSYVYIACGASYAPKKFDGTTTTTLTASGPAAWQDSFASPTGTHMPKAELCTTHIDRMWVAYTRENATSYPNRIRWSHPGFPESWRENDYIDVVDGGSGITGIVPFGDQLLIFKPRAVFALSGYDEESFQLVPLTTEIGAANPQCVVKSEQALFFFSWPDGVFAYNGSGFTNISQPIHPIIDENLINENSLTGMYLSWVDRALMFSVPLGATPLTQDTYEVAGGTYDASTISYGGATKATKPTVTFVWDPAVREGGAWTRYKTGDNYGIAHGTTFLQSDGSRVPVALHPYHARILRINQITEHYDTINGTVYNFDSYYVTKWQDAKSVNARKFWRRPEMVVRQLGETISLPVSVYHDWNTAVSARTFTVDLDGEYVEGGYGSFGQSDLGSDLVKGHNLGLANSVQLKISGDAGKPWGVNAITYKYNPRRVRT